MEPAAFPTLEPFAKRLESLRLQRGFTQRALAERAQISTNHYQDIAHAQANPTTTVLLSLANALDVSVVDLFAPTPSPDTRRVVFVADLKDLAAAHRQLTEIIERIAEGDMWRLPRGAQRRSHRR